MSSILITGVTGMVGSTLADKLIEDNLVYGLKRRTSTENHENIQHLIGNPKFILLEGDTTDPVYINRIVDDFQFDKIFHCAAQSYVKASFDQPKYTLETIVNSTLYFLEAIRRCSPNTQFLHLSSSEMFGKNYTEDNSGNRFQDENTTYMPQSPYGVAKMAAHHLVRIYREAYKLYVCSSICFNMEGPRRGREFITKKIANYVGRGDFSKPLELGNLDSVRDWNYVGDSCDAMIAMLKQDYAPKDLVIGSGTAHTIAEFLQEAFACVGIKDWQKYVVSTPSNYRPLDVVFLKANPSLARQTIHYHPKTTFKELVQMMVKACQKNTQ